MFLSILGIVTCCPFGIAGAIMGHVAMRQIHDRGEDGDGYAKAGIIVGWGGVALWFSFVIGGAFAVLFYSLNEQALNR